MQSSFIEALSFFCFGLIIVVFLYLLISLFRRKRAKATILVLLAIIVSCVLLPIRLIMVDLPQGIPNGTYHFTCHARSDGWRNKSIDTSVEVYAKYNSTTHEYTLREIKGIDNVSLVSENVKFRSGQELIVRIKHTYY